MNVFEGSALVGGAWILLAALVNAIDGRWLASLLCLSLAASAFVFVFGRSRDRAWNRQQRQNAELLARLERETHQPYTTGEYVKNAEGFYVRKDDIRGDLGSGSGHDPQRDQCGGEGAVR